VVRRAGITAPRVQHTIARTVVRFAVRDHRGKRGNEPAEWSSVRVHREPRREPLEYGTVIKQSARRWNEKANAQ